jgi:hypothetical protein
MDVTVFLDPTPNLEQLATILDGLGHEGRVHTVATWSKKEQAAIFEAAKGFRPLTLDHFVPASAEKVTEVIHEGRNTLPAFSHFQKRFFRSDDEDGALYGYNHQDLTWATGPGYFEVRLGEEEGEIAIDYAKRLPTKPPAGWPPVVGNNVRLGPFVYEGMIDYMRGISEHVAIGRAFKKGAYMDAWFVLVRKDA